MNFFRAGHDLFDQLGQLTGRLYGPCPHDCSGYLPAPPFLAQPEDQVGELLLGFEIDNVGGGPRRMSRPMRMSKGPSAISENPLSPSVSWYRDTPKSASSPSSCETPSAVSVSSSCENKL